MTEIWHLLPASLWPVQRFIPPDEQAQILQSALSLGIPLGSSAPAPATPAPRDTTTSQSLPPQDPPEMLLPMVAGPYRGDATTPAGILGAILGAEPSNATQPPTQYGMVPRSLPPEFRLPPPRLSDWQRPESDFGIGSPEVRANIDRALAGGLPADRIIIGDPAARWHRDTARIADFAFPGSGNFVSGDWNNITGKDVARLALGSGLTVASALTGVEAPIGSLAARAAFEGDAGAASGAARSALGRATPFKGTSPRVPDIPFEPGPSGSAQLIVGNRSGSQLADEVFAPHAAQPAGAGPALPADLDHWLVEALSRRAHEIHGALKHDIERTQRTTAVLSTDGDTIVASGGRDLTPRQLSLLYEYEHPAALRDKHSEITALFEALKRGWRPRAIATTREICPECSEFMESLGGVRTGPTTYIFPRQGDFR